MKATSCWLAMGAFALGNGLIPLTAAAQDWWLEGGPVFRGSMKVSVEGSSYVQGLGLHSPAATGPLSSPTGIGTLNGYADRIYDNGYVKLDPGTGNAAAVGGPNTTWNWGFANPVQYDAGARTLSFEKQGELGYNTLANGSVGGSDELLGAGLQLMAGLPLIKCGRWSADVALGFQGIWGGHSQIEATTYREEVRQMTVTDIYDVSGIPSASFPAQGFHGTYLGPFDNPRIIPSPVIPNVPSARVSSTSAALYTAQNQIAFDLDQSLYQLSLGPKIAYAVSRRVKLNVRPSISLNVIDVEVKRTEVFVQSSAGGSSVVLNRWFNQGEECGLLLGLGATAGADVDLGKGFYAGVYGGYEWVAEQVNVSVGPNTVSFDGGGWVEPDLLLISCILEPDPHRHLLQPVGVMSSKLTRMIQNGAAELSYPLKVIGVSDRFLKDNPDFSSCFAVLEDRAVSNYIYSAESLALLPGRKYAKKRNLLSQAAGLYSWSCTMLNSQLIDRCFAVLDSIMEEEHPQMEGMLKRELAALECTLRHFDEFDQQGVLVSINDRPVAFSIYEAISPTTVAIHFERALRSYKGLYQVVNCETAKVIVNQGFQFINREEDLGDAGLRDAKMSYHPIEVAPAYELTYRKPEADR